jgi:hypothetical protein
MNGSARSDSQAVDVMNNTSAYYPYQQQHDNLQQYGASHVPLSYEGSALPQSPSHRHRPYHPLDTSSSLDTRFRSLALSEAVADAPERLHEVDKDRGEGESSTITSTTTTMSNSSLQQQPAAAGSHGDDPGKLGTSNSPPGNGNLSNHGNGSPHNDDDDARHGHDDQEDTSAANDEGTSTAGAGEDDGDEEDPVKLFVGQVRLFVVFVSCSLSRRISLATFLRITDSQEHVGRRYLSYF